MPTVAVQVIALEQGIDDRSPGCFGAQAIGLA